jgi:ATPase involved in DNA repair
MRPLKLKISGLNSFRETQEIDFERLGDTGVFGIFGPTGSGKSTILDAITLALYGTVERAANNTQGILNHAETSLAVELTFVLGSGEKRKYYRAERSYKRSGEKTVKASTCRLVQLIGSQETVLTNKAEEMGKKIREILGLTIDDFTRAVVLPQGKFAEFLTIKPKDRREMLERLFALEIYGKDLSARLSAQQQETTQKYIGVEQRQQGLGDASAERLAQAELDLEQTIYSAAGLGENLTILRQKQEEDKEVWTLQQQQGFYQEKLSKLLKKQTEINTFSERLNLAERAETIRPLLEGLRLKEAQLEEAGLKAEEANSSMEAAHAEKEQAEEKWSEAKQQRIVTEPQLLRRLEQLEQAKSLETEIDERAIRLAQMRDDYKKIATIKTEIELKIQNLNKQKSEFLGLELQYKNRLQEITIEPEQRSRIIAANKALEACGIISRQLENAQQDLAECGKVLEKLQKELKNSQQTVQKAQKEVSRLKEQQTGLQQKNSLTEESVRQELQSLESYKALYANLERSEFELRSEQAKLQEIAASVQFAEENSVGLESDFSKSSLLCRELSVKYEAGVLQVKELEENNLAVSLAAGLTEGVPCPVCGSTQHPLPAQRRQEDQALEVSKQELALMAQELKTLETDKNALTTKIAVAKDQLLSKHENLQQQGQVCLDRQEDLANYRKLLSEAEQNWTLEQLSNKLTERENKLKREHEQLTENKRVLEELVQKYDLAQKELTQAAAAEVEVQIQIASEAAVQENKQTDLNRLLMEQVQRKTNLDQIRGSLEPDEIPELQDKYAKWDQESVLIKQKLDQAEKTRNQLEITLTDLNAEKNRQDLELTALETAGREAGQIHSEQTAKLNQITEGKRIAELTNCCLQELERVVKAEETCKVLCEQGKTRFARAEQELAVLNNEKELKKAERDSASGSLAEGLKAAQFSTIALVESALCEQAEREYLSEEIKNFIQGLSALQKQLEDIAAKLAGRSLSPQEWLAWTIRLEEAEKAYREAVARQGAAQQVLQELKEKHSEWVKLEKSRKFLSHRSGLLKTLQTVLKGNTFVEFIAEEQLVNVALTASERLGQLTNYRFALEVDSEGGFVIRDDANGGYRRPVGSLSGGETFLTSLALALALSAQIQLRGESPLEFFFLDEGFGTLDPDLLETVMAALEKLHMQNMTIGIISHVPELKNRLARRLILTAAEPGGAGSKIKLERA